MDSLKTLPAHERAYLLQMNAYELRKLFTTIVRLVDSLPEAKRDHETKYIAGRGAQLAEALGEELDRFAMDLSPAPEAANNG